MLDNGDNYVDVNETDLWDSAFGEISLNDTIQVGNGVPHNLPISSMAADPGGMMGLLVPSSSVDSGDGMGDNLTNFQQLPLRDSLSVVIPITIVYVIILVTGLVGNVVTCIVIVRSRYLHTATNYYLFSLAISDLLLLLSGLPVEIHSMWQRYPYIFGEIFCIVRGLAAETSANATVLTITAFTIERYLAICRPFMIQKWNNKLSRVVRQIIFIWLVSFTLAIPQALQLGILRVPVGNNENGEVKVDMCTVKKPLVEHSFEIATIVFFVAPMLLITALYILIGLTLRNASHVKEGKLRLRKSMSSNKREVGQQRVLKMLVAVVIAFFVCWAPFHAQRLIWKWSNDWGKSSSKEALILYEIATYLSGVLYYVATCVNPETMSGCCGGKDAQRRRQGYRNTTHSTSCSSRSQGLCLTDITLTISSSQNGSTKCHHHNHPQNCGRVVAL